MFTQFPVATPVCSESDYDVVVIGGGFYGCCLALALVNRYPRILILEREADLLTGASYVNQARVHNGYHYPRSLLTALRSAANYPRFTRDFSDCIDHTFQQVYAIARGTSKVNGYQFRKFCEQANLTARPAPSSILKLFNPALIETAFVTEECAFDASKLRLHLAEKLNGAGIEVACGQEVDRLLPGTRQSVNIQTTSGLHLTAATAFNCTYSGINRLLDQSGVTSLPLKHELAEIALIQVPEPLARLGITVMDGPYFSTMPFPARGLHSLSHVRYTPHHCWSDHNHTQTGGSLGPLTVTPRSNSIFMLRDAQRYVPSLREARVVDSLFQTKTLLLQNELDDGRPILCRSHYGMPNLWVVLGAKIDNIYDIIETIDRSHLSHPSTHATASHFTHSISKAPYELRD